jgi:hypothetical protein
MLNDDFQIKFYLYKQIQLMEREQHELYEYARKRLKTKKGLYLHFVLLFLASLFLFVSVKLFNFGLNSNWYIRDYSMVFLFFFYISLKCL